MAVHNGPTDSSNVERGRLRHVLPEEDLLIAR